MAINNVLCYDILEQILPFLPVKSLFRFKAVCVSTRDLISSPKFIECYSTAAPNRAVCQIYLSDESGKVPWPNDIDAAAELSTPFHDAPIEHVVGSCNGLLLVVIADRSLLWNPSTREYLELSKNSIWNMVTRIDTVPRRVPIGLGYDSVADEYKVVLWIDRDHTGQHGLLIYGLRTGWWKKVAPPQDLYYQLNRCKCGVTVNGCPHWMVSNRDGIVPYNPYVSEFYSLIYFDITEENLKSLSTPIERICHHTEYEPRLGTLNGRLCASVKSHMSTTEIWVMKEFGVGDSWNKLFVFRHPNIQGTFRPLGFIGDEVVMVSSTGKIVTCGHSDGKQKDIRGDVAVKYRASEFQLVEYTESLVSPRTLGIFEIWPSM